MQNEARGGGERRIGRAEVRQFGVVEPVRQGRRHRHHQRRDDDEAGRQPAQIVHRAARIRDGEGQHGEADQQRRRSRRRRRARTHRRAPAPSWRACSRCARAPRGRPSPGTPSPRARRRQRGCGSCRARFPAGRQTTGRGSSPSRAGRRSEIDKGRWRARCSRAVAITNKAAIAVVAILRRRCAPEDGNGDHRIESAAQANKPSATQTTGDLRTHAKPFGHAGRRIKRRRDQQQRDRRSGTARKWIACDRTTALGAASARTA